MKDVIYVCLLYVLFSTENSLSKKYSFITLLDSLWGLIVVSLVKQVIKEAKEDFTEMNQEQELHVSFLLFLIRVNQKIRV